ncbi:putative nucleolar protein nop58 protein [Lasiodiplodia theobromae]|uniref:Nucleolar protein 58 n=1 Tax=Lasiodiplodia theobromae TaxID=45133 RepID=A0A5N5DPQ6_9PEZI|nr:Nucleolar protein nop58 [Lasiodiplodia theobromae]KAB2578734.1 Nucleolar protein 58 [Lasiodiplodia theobromae]KAF4535450.1 Nucleolar protein nop58 [Lasiodiplodia theobromae]KAF9638729.1 putative nucleolar protein nop58 protein [Lasiodiplodia theobromae]
MTLFILTETSAGYALLKAKDKKLLKRDDLVTETETAEGVCGLLKLKKFEKFDSAATALNEAAALTDGKVTPMLSSLLDEIKDEKKASLAVADPKLGNAINKLPGLSITPISDSSTQDVFRAIRLHLTSLIPALKPDDVSTMSLGLSHSLSRHKLKFSTDKVDTMIIQAISLLDDLDKELNIYAMRVKEWYGWHFPEMAKIINDNVAYSRVILAMGMRSNCVNTDLSDVLPEEIEASLKVAAEVSMGTEITDEDLENIKALAEQVVGFTEYRQTLSNYLSTRMQAIAPNLTALVGDLVGARLIAHAGSLISLAKSPGSTIQILGAEKALFRALKTKHDTPKYGLIYHASLIGQASGKNKGKIARMLASKAALGLRVDSLADWGANSEGTEEEPTEEEKAALGNTARLAIERRLRALEGKPIQSKGTAIAPSGQNKAPKFDIKEAKKYNADADGLTGNEPAANDKSNGIEEVDGASESESESEDDAPKKSKGGDKAAKKAEKEAKKARKAERAAKREAKEAKKAAKEAKKASKDATEGATDPKKRKRDDEGEKSEKKKKKKSKD